MAGIATGTTVTMANDIIVGTDIAFAKGEQVIIEGVSPNAQGPGYQYVVTSSRMGKQFQLREVDLLPLAGVSQPLEAKPTQTAATGSDLKAGTVAEVTKTALLDGKVAFNLGDIVLVEAVRPHKSNPDLKYVVTSKLLNMSITVGADALVVAPPGSVVTPEPARKKAPALTPLQAAAGEVRALEALGDVEGIAKFFSIKTMPNPDWQGARFRQLDNAAGKSIRTTAMAALVRIGNSHAAEALIEHLGEDGVCLDKAEVTKSLVEIGEPAVGSLTEALDDENHFIRQGAQKALKKMAVPRRDGGSPRAVEALESPRQLQPLLEGLKAWGSSAVKDLEKMGWQPDRGEDGARYWIIKQKWDKCASIGAPAVGPLVTALGCHDLMVKNRRGVINALAKIGPPAVVPLIEALGDKDWIVTVYAAEALGKIGDPRATEPLKVALENMPEGHSKQARNALINIQIKAKKGKRAGP